jgi:hypothetical protein
VGVPGEKEKLEKQRENPKTKRDSPKQRGKVLSPRIKKKEEKRNTATKINK